MKTSNKVLACPRRPIRKSAVSFVWWSFAIGLLAADPDATRIQPWPDNPSYWKYKGRPVLLLGGSKDDNLFQIPDLVPHLDAMVHVGANYIRNTMSDRHDKGFELYPFKRLGSGKYDLDQWNEEYWQRFAHMLEETSRRDIIVQIELWDRFDYSQENWKPHPYNPANNVNYTSAESGLATDYPQHAWLDRQPFFHAVPGMPHYRKELDRVRHYQERFVSRLLHLSLPYGHVLYCMNNETTTPPAWGRYWMEFIRRKARERGLNVFVTDMFDDVWKPQRSRHFREQLDHPEAYTFLDVSQVNSRTFNEDHWNNLRWIMDQVRRHPRPVNHVKIYSAGQTSWGSGTPKDGVERFWRNLIGGSAACRFHRPGGGIGLNAIAQACIQAARKVHTLVPFWDGDVHQELVSEREPDEVYVRAHPGKHYIVYFTNGGSVKLDLTKAPGQFDVRWVNIATGDWGPRRILTGGAPATMAAPDQGPWVAVLKRTAP